jgi:4-hydroxy-tetrahydrodipicolinate reductase
VTLGVVVTGIQGRMGALVAEAARTDPRTTLLCGTARTAVPGDVPVVTSLERALRDSGGTRVVVDFTTPGSTAQHAAWCAEHGVALVVGTTGLDDTARAALERASHHVPVLVAANTSRGAHLLASLAKTAARVLPDSDVEIVELHHKRKKDSPSGTALMLEQAVANARGQVPSDVLVTSRSGDAPRQLNEVGVFGVRGGDVVGEHTVYLFLDGERIELTHRVSDRRIFAAGALHAAIAIATRGPGLVQMADVLGV